MKKTKNRREEFIKKLIKGVKGLTREEAEIILDTVKDLLKASYKRNRSIKFVDFRSKAFEFHPKDLKPILRSL